jgi:hypothetical protein
LPQEWQFVQRVTKRIGPDFQDVKLVLSKTFLWTLFGDDFNKSNPHHKLSCLLVKWAGLVIPDPTVSADPNYEVSVLLCSHILATFRGIYNFQLADHTAVILEVKAELKICNLATKNEAAMTSLTLKLSCDNCRMSL